MPRPERGQEDGVGEQLLKAVANCHPSAALAVQNHTLCIQYDWEDPVVVVRERAMMGGRRGKEMERERENGRRDEGRAEGSTRVKAAEEERKQERKGSKRRRKGGRRGRKGTKGK